MTKEEVKEINEEVNEALKAIAAKHNMKATKCSLTWDNCTLNWRLEARTLDENGNMTVDLRKRFAAQSRLAQFGISYSGDIFGETKSVKGLGYCRISDFLPRSPKYPFVVVDSKGKSYKTTVESIAW